MKVYNCSDYNDKPRGLAQRIIDCCRVTGEKN